MYVTFCCVSKSKTENQPREESPQRSVTTVNGGLTVQRYEYFSYLSIVWAIYFTIYIRFIDLYQDKDSILPQFGQI